MEATLVQYIDDDDEEEDDDIQELEQQGTISLDQLVKSIKDQEEDAMLPMFNVTTAGVSLVGYSVKEIKQLKRDAIDILNILQVKSQSKIGF